MKVFSHFNKTVITSLICIFIIILDFKFNYLSSIKKSVSILTTPIYYIINLPYQYIIETDYKKVTKQELLRENIFLKTKLQKYNSLLFENKNLKEKLNATFDFDKNTFMLANIINVNQSRFKKQFIINKGSVNGVYEGQAVLGTNGIIGQIKDVSLKHSTVLAITDSLHFIPVKNQKNGLRGVASGYANYSNRLKLKFVENNADIKVGDIFVSSNLGKKFPKNYPVAKVIKATNNLNRTFMDIELESIENMDKLEFVLLILSEN